MTYSEKLKDPRWQKKRLEILQRDNFTCLCCDNITNETLNVHHLYYEKGVDPWNYDNHSLITLCDTCHYVIHTIDKIVENSHKYKNIGYESYIAMFHFLIKIEEKGIETRLKNEL